ncbi:MAG: hypothetical protein ACI37Z_09965 [Candidatus Gastranaerophilaceae bacterium]
MKKIFSLLIIVILTTGAGYEGALPNLEDGLGYKIKSKKVKYSPVMTTEKDIKLEPVPRENKEYVDIIIKKSRTAEYIKDIQPVIDLLEKFKTYVEDDKNVQMFNAIASNYIDHANYIQRKYANRPERHYTSYRAIVMLAENARSSAMLRSEGVIYTKYLPYANEGQKYDKTSIKSDGEALVKKIYETLYVLKNLD